MHCDDDDVSAKSTRALRLHVLTQCSRWRCYTAGVAKHTSDNASGSAAAIGRTRWAIAEGYLPAWSNGPAPQLESHEACCILNAGDAPAQVEITVYFEDREPVGPYRFTIEARRTKHLRFNDFSDPEPIPKDTPYASVIVSDVPVVVQHTRLDSRQAENALMTTVAYAAAD